MRHCSLFAAGLWAFICLTSVAQHQWYLAMLEGLLCLFLVLSISEQE